MLGVDSDGEDGGDEDDDGGEDSRGEDEGGNDVKCNGDDDVVVGAPPARPQMISDVNFWIL